MKTSQKGFPWQSREIKIKIKIKLKLRLRYHAPVAGGMGLIPDQKTKLLYASWCGHAFEITCLHHINNIVKALGIDGCINIPCAWSYRPTSKTLADEDADEDLKQGAQIDLLIDRSDKSISICEMKYCQGEYEINKAYDAHLMHRLNIFKKVTKTNKTLIPTFITPYGLYNNMYARKITRQVTGDDLFA